MASSNRTPAAVGVEGGAGGRADRLADRRAKEPRIGGRVRSRGRGADPGTGRGPVAGTYVGQTDEALPRHVECRFLGTGIRDLTIGGRLVARRIPVKGPDARGSAGGADVRLSWIGSRQVNGKYVRRGRRRAEVLRFTATHRFRTHAA